MVTFDKRRIFAVVGPVAMLFLVVACGGKKEDPSKWLAQIDAITKEANQLRERAAAVQKACAKKSEEVQRMLAMGSGNLSPEAQQRLMVAVGLNQPQGGAAGQPIEECMNSSIQYFQIAKAIQEKDFADRAAKDKEDLTTAWAKNTQYRDAALKLFADALWRAGGNAALSPVQLLQVAQQYGSQIPALAAQLGLTQAEIAPLMAQVNGLQNRALMLLATQGNQQGSGVANGGSLGINGGSGVGGGSGSGGINFGGSFIASGQGASGGKVVSGGGLGIGTAGSGTGGSSGTKVPSVGSRLNLNMGSGNGAAKRYAAGGDVVSLADNPNVLRLRKAVGGDGWFQRRRKPANTSVY